MVAIRLGDPEDNNLASRISHLRTLSQIDLEARQDRIAIQIRVMDIESPITSVVRVEGQAKEAALAATINLVADIEKRDREQLTILEDADDTGLLDDK